MDDEHKYNLTGEVENYRGKYLKFTTKYFDTVKQGKEVKVKWECIYRVGAGGFKVLNGAECIPIVKNTDGSLSVLLIENFRYPVEKKVLEFPSGLIDQEEYQNLEDLLNKISASNCQDQRKSFTTEFDKLLTDVMISSTKRELKEETGYVGEFKSFFVLPESNPITVFSNMFIDPWKSKENAAMGIFIIDKNLEVNKNPQQDLDESEVIKTHEVQLDQLLNFITKKIEQENYSCLTHLYTFAMGLQFNSMVKDI